MADNDEDLREQVAALRRSLDNQAGEIRRLRQDHQALRLENEALRGEIGELRSQEAELLAMLKHAQGDNIRLRRELAAVRYRLQIAEEAAKVDTLTKAFRLDAFTVLLQEQILRPPRLPPHMQEDGKGSMLLFLDLIGFKETNEQFGHAEANNVLRHLVRVLYDKGTIRLYDPACVGEDEATEPGVDKKVGRFGGDEFLVYCCEVTQVEARKIALRVKQRCESEAVMLTQGGTGAKVVHHARLHVAAVWWPRSSSTWRADEIIAEGGVLITEAKKGRHDPTHISWKALTAPN